MIGLLFKLTFLKTKMNYWQQDDSFSQLSKRSTTSVSKYISNSFIFLSVNVAQGLVTTVMFSFNQVFQEEKRNEMSLVCDIFNKNMDIIDQNEFFYGLQKM